MPVKVIRKSDEKKKDRVQRVQESLYYAEQRILHLLSRLSLSCKDFAPEKAETRRKLVEQIFSTFTIYE